jgi:tartrate dehydratase alpha subunit/fumarate hydratase class I-like protein
MRTIAFETIAAAVEALCIQCAYELPDDVLAALRSPLRRKPMTGPAYSSGQLLENARTPPPNASRGVRIRGWRLMFVELGSGVQVIRPLTARGDAD